MGWNYLFIPKLQRFNRWSLGMDKYFNPTLYWACDYLYMLGLKLNHVSKRSHWSESSNWFKFISIRYRTVWTAVAHFCPACQTSLIATRFWVVVICPIIKCLTVLEFSFILFDLCLLITIFNFILNYVPIVTFWIFTYHKIWILLIIFCFIWSYWIIYFLTCLEVFWSVVS